MPNVRHTPARQRMVCPVCQRDVSYTRPWEPDPFYDGRGDHLRRSPTHRVLKGHTNPSTGGPCEVNGRFGLNIADA